MKMRWLAFVALTLLLIGAGSVLAAPGSGKSFKDRVPLEPYMGVKVSETEPNNTCGEANGPFTAEIGIEAELEHYDLDWYAFEFTAGDTVIIETRPVEGEPEVDTVIALIGPDCSTDIDDDDDSGVGYYSLMAFPIATSGTYHIVVSGYDNIQDGNYALVLTYPVPFSNHTCETAIPLDIHVEHSFLFSTCGGYNNYDPGDDENCVGFAMPGQDVVYSIDMEEGTLVDIWLENTHDGALYLITDCSDPVGSCVAGMDGYFTGNPENLIYTAEETTRYYLVIDDWGTGCGWAMIMMTSSVPNQTQSWGAVKSLYR